MRSCGSSILALYAIAVLLGIGISSPLSAFLIQTYEGRNGPVSQSWNRDTVRFSLDSDGSDDLDSERAMEILRQSFTIWESVPTTALRFEDTGLSDIQPDTDDGRNHVIFDESGRWLDAPPETGIIAVTRINSDSFTGSIEDADIIFNGRDFRFGEGTVPQTVNLMDVAVHEIGHLIGLDHTPLEGPSSSRPTMNPFYDNSGPGEASTLEADDIAGVSVIYPTAAFLASSATVSGRIEDDLADDVFGALVAAERQDSGEIISTLTGAYPNSGGRGSYFLRGLPPGSYRIFIAPIEGRINEHNFGGIFEKFDTDFPLEYYDNAERDIFATTLEVEPGAAIEGVDFTTGFAPPGFPRITPVRFPVNTPDSAGPYTVRARIIDALAAKLTVRLNGGWSEHIPMVAGDGANTFEAEISGAPIGSRLEYRIEAKSEEALTTVYPSSGTWLDFEIVALSGAPLAFVVFREENSVGVIDTGRDLELARIPVGDNPIQLLATPDGAHLFVSNLVSDEITMIETATFSVVRTIPVWGEPLDLAISAEGRDLYVTHTGSSTLSKIDVASGSVEVSSVAGLQRGSYGIAIAAGRVYVTDIGNDEVILTPAKSGSSQGSTTRIPVVDSPRSVAASPDENTLYVTSFTMGDVSVIDVASNSVIDVISLGASGSFAVWPSRDGSSVYFTDHDDGNLIVVDAKSREVEATIRIGENPRGISESPDGKLLFVTSAASNHIHVIDMATNEVLTVYETGREPRGIAVVLAPPTNAVTAVEPQPAPEAFQLIAPFPNPFNSEVQIPFTLTANRDRSPVNLGIYNVAGQKIRTLIDGDTVGGGHIVLWDGKDDTGRAIASGVYLVRLRTDLGESVRKISLLR